MLFVILLTNCWYFNIGTIEDKAHDNSRREVGVNSTFEQALTAPQPNVDEKRSHGSVGENSGSK